jgi:pimeloyl-ACP methyl ester carboxylesterase
VYVIDLLGFGFSAQPDTPHTFNRWGGHVWAQQICDFISEVILPASASKKVVVAGNSLGGYSSLLAAGAGTVRGGEIGGLVLVNSAGSFLPEDDAEDPLAAVDRQALLASVDPEPTPMDPAALIGQALKRVLSFGGFILTREARIESTLKLVYTDVPARVDEDLVDLIKRPAMQPNAFEVFFKTTLGGRGNKAVSINRLAQEIEKMRHVARPCCCGAPWCPVAVVHMTCILNLTSTMKLTSLPRARARVHRAGSQRCCSGGRTIRGSR